MITISIIIAIVIIAIVIIAIVIIAIVIIAIVIMAAAIVIIAIIITWAGAQENNFDGEMMSLAFASEPADMAQAALPGRGSGLCLLKLSAGTNWQHVVWMGAARSESSSSNYSCYLRPRNTTR